MRVPLLNFERGPGVPLLNFEGGLGSWFPGPEVPSPGVLVPLLHHALVLLYFWRRSREPAVNEVFYSRFKVRFSTIFRSFLLFG